MKYIKEFIDGKKTYILAAVAVVYALSGFVLGHIDGQTAVDMIWAALTAGALRSGVKSAVKELAQ